MYIPELNFPEPKIDLKDAFGDLASRFKSKVRDGVSAFTKLLNGVGSGFRELVEPLIQEVFENFKSLLKDITFTANELLNKSKALAEDLLNQAFERLSELVTQVEQSVGRLLTQVGDVVTELIVKVRQELLEPFVTAVNEFRKNLVSDLKELINQTVEKVVDEVNKVLYKADVLVTGTLASLTNELLKVYVDLEKFDLGNLIDSDERREFKRHKSCKEENDIEGSELRLLGNGKLYDYLECKDIKRLSEKFERSNGDVKVKSIKTTYSDLQERAWQLACLGRNSALQDKALQGFVKYGQLYKLWNQFEDDMTAFSVMEQQIKDLDGRINRLDEKIATFQGKSDQIDTLNLTVNQAQNTANDAVNRANNAQNTANSGISGISSLQSGIQDGSVVALKASMLRARDDNHWMRFNTVDASNHDVFMLWRTDNTFHPTIRVQASDKLLARNDSHWMRYKLTNASNQECYGLWVINGQWHNLIQVGSTGPLP
jgi:methyl-accepting chemotaxis protein